MKAEIDFNLLPDNHIDWWLENKSGQMVIHTREIDLAADAIWIASLVEIQEKEECCSTQYVAFIDPTHKDPGMLFDLSNEAHVAELRLHKPLMKGLGLSLHKINFRQ